MVGTNGDLAQKIIDARKRRGWRRTDLVCYSGLSDNTVASAERFGKVTPRTAKRLAPLLGLELSELLP